jgi:hypothetical protein
MKSTAPLFYSSAGRSGATGDLRLDLFRFDPDICAVCRDKRIAAFLVSVPPRRRWRQMCKLPHVTTVMKEDGDHYLLISSSNFVSFVCREERNDLRALFVFQSRQWRQLAAKT